MHASLAESRVTKLFSLLLLALPCAAGAASSPVEQTDKATEVLSFYFKQIDSCRQRVVGVSFATATVTLTDLTGVQVQPAGTNVTKRQAIIALDTTVDTCAGTATEKLFDVLQSDDSTQPVGGPATTTHSCVDSITSDTSNCPWLAIGKHAVIALASGETVDQNGAVGKGQVAVASVDKGKPINSQSLVAKNASAIYRTGNDVVHQHLAQALDGFVKFNDRVISVNTSGVVNLGTGNILAGKWDDSLSFRFDLTESEGAVSWDAFYNLDPVLNADAAALIGSLQASIEALTASAPWAQSVLGNLNY